METNNGLPTERAGQSPKEEVVAFSLTDYLQVAALGQHSVRIGVVLRSGASGTVDLERGLLRHAELRNHRGLEAFALLLGAPLSSITVNALPRPLKETELEVSVDRALLELAMARDTGTDEDAGAGAETAGEVPVEKLTGNDPFEAIYARAVEVSLIRDYGTALMLFRRALELRPDDGRVLHNIRRIEVILGKGG